jgi:hypothetical protein
VRIVLLVARRVVADPQLDHKPGRQGNVGAWRVEKGQIVRDASVVSRNGDETRTRGRRRAVEGRRQGAHDRPREEQRGDGRPAARMEDAGLDALA